MITLHFLTLSMNGTSNAIEVTSRYGTIPHAFNCQSFVSLCGTITQLSRDQVKV